MREREKERHNKMKAKEHKQRLKRMRYCKSERQGRDRDKSTIRRKVRKSKEEIYREYKMGLNEQGANVIEVSLVRVLLSCRLVQININLERLDQWRDSKNGRRAFESRINLN